MVDFLCPFAGAAEAGSLVVLWWCRGAVGGGLVRGPARSGGEIIRDPDPQWELGPFTPDPHGPGVGGMLL